MARRLARRGRSHRLAERLRCTCSRGSARAHARRARAEARSHLGLADDAALHHVIGRLADRAALSERLAALLNDLRASADGLEEAELWAEQADVDLVTLDVSIEELKRRRANIADEI